jgi:FtsZ-binding cell division protein ZapB
MRDLREFHDHDAGGDHLKECRACEIERLRGEGDELEGTVEGLLETIKIYKTRIEELEKENRILNQSAIEGFSDRDQRIEELSQTVRTLKKDMTERDNRIVARLTMWT